MSARRSPADVVDSLVSNLAPVRPVRIVPAIVAAAAIEIGVVAVMILLLGIRIADPARLLDPAFAALLAVLAGSAAASIVAMTAVSIPGRAPSRASRLAIVAVPPLLASVVLAMSPWGATTGAFTAVLVEGFGCTKNTLVVAAPAWLAALLYLRRLAPLDPVRTGLFAAFSALLVSALVVQMACPQCESWHLAMSHYLPLLLAAWAGALFAPIVVKAASPR